MINIILCGGSGTRLWPISRSKMPKQFVRLFENHSLFQKTVQRNSKLCSSSFVVSNADQYFLALDQLEELDRPGNKFLLEPVGRNTAPAIALACMLLEPEQVVLVSPSDHLVKKQGAYETVLQKAQKLAEEGNLVTFGITPDGPATGYGYIEADGEDVKRFCEKPDRETARSYLEQGNFFWNSGMFSFQAGTFLEELKAYAPDILDACKKALDGVKADEKGLYRIGHDEMALIPSNSIDYAVMEHSQKVKVVPADIAWSDLGSFDALHAELPQDDKGNTFSEKHLGIGSSNNLIMTQDRLITTIDMEDHLIVDTQDAVLVAPQKSAQKVKEIVDILKERNSELPDFHAKVNRPWGTYTILREGQGYKIKRITVKPEARISLQKHYHRSEHWIVLRGTAKVTVNDETFLVRPNESTYIGMGDMHRLENPGKIELEIVEVQVGNYVGEDDIERFEDDYRRV